jgi:hypothetical protein
METFGLAEGGVVRPAPNSATIDNLLGGVLKSGDFSERACQASRLFSEKARLRLARDQFANSHFAWREPP